MKVTTILVILGALTLDACGQPGEASTAGTIVALGAPAIQSASSAQPTAAPTPTLPVSPNTASRLQETDPMVPLASEVFRIYGLGGLAASSTRTTEQYQQDVASAVVRNLAARLYVREEEVRIVSVQDTDITSCGGKTASPAPDQRTPGFEIIAEAGGTAYRYLVSGALGRFCGQALP